MKMDKKRIELTVTGILVLVFVFAWANSIRLIRAKMKGRKAPAAVVAQYDVFAQSSTTRPQPRIYVEDEGLDWKRCPFCGEFFTQVEDSTNLRLSGILWDAKNPQAVIGSEVYGKGDKIGKFIVVDINPDKVVLSDGSKQIELKLY